MTRPLMMRLPHGETHPDLCYSMPDPDELEPAYTAAYRAHYYEERALTRSELAQILMLAQGYLWLTTDNNQSRNQDRVRDIWRARRARCRSCAHLDCDQARAELAGEPAGGAA